MALRRKKNKVEAMVAGDKIAYGLLKSFLLPVLTLLFRPKVSGLRFVPSTGPVIIASNHLSFSDSIFMPLVIPRKVTFLAKSEYFTSPGLKGLVKKLTFIALGQVSVIELEDLEVRQRFLLASQFLQRAAALVSIPKERDLQMAGFIEGELG
jgi:1-acyl-sn-glycerol-3-phosphate acyltransferase